MPPISVLGGLAVLASFAMSPATVKVEQNQWTEPVILWLSINMPTGSGKSSLYRVLTNMAKNIRIKCKCTRADPQWELGDATFEKMGFLMSNNDGRLLGIYDELTSFLTQINLFRSRGLCDTHESALFLQLYNGNRTTGTYKLYF